MSMTSRLMAFVKDRPGQWIPATAFEQFGRQAWRTRLSEARQKFEAVNDGTIENRQRHVLDEGGVCFIASEYRYVLAVKDAPQSDQYDANAVPAGRLV